MAKGKTAELATWVERERPQKIGEPEWQALKELLAPISESYLRRLVRGSQIPLSPLVEGVRQESFKALEASLAALLDEYEAADPPRRAAVRKLVIAAKDHAHWAARKPERKEEKEEMILWMLTWLENPPLFRDWVRLRRRAQ